MESMKKKEKSNPRKTANIISIAFFWWVKDIIWNGYKRNLGEEDLFDPLDEHRSGTLGNHLQSKWEEELLASQKNNKSPSLIKAISKTFFMDLLTLGAYQVVMDMVLKVSQPLLLAQLLIYFKLGSDESLKDAVFYASGIIICTGINSFITSHFSMAAISTGMKIRIACSSLIYRKVLKLSRDSLSDVSAGKLTNLLSNDVARFDVFVQFLHSLWTSPLTSFIMIYLIWREMGIPGIMGLAVLILVFPIQVYFSIRMKHYRQRAAERTDTRLKLIQEILSGIRAIKLYVWESVYLSMSEKTRRSEIKELRKMCYLRGMYVSVGTWTTRASFSLVLVTVIFFGGHLASEKVFVCLLYYGTLLYYLFMQFLRATAEIAETLASVNRVKIFLLKEEFIKSDTLTMIPPCGNENSKPPVVLNNVNMKWNLSSSEDILKGINITIKKGELVIVVGTVGSGKSSLLQTILGEPYITNGTCCVEGRLSYASQEPWVFAATIRQNITFGAEFDKKLYDQIVRACDLTHDFQQFSKGDKTIVGERGSSLSGGQKARVNLARCLYDQADIYLLDDPLSAVDTQVGKHLFEKCIMTFLDGKTRILVTHQLQYLQYADQIIILNNGKVSMKGTFEDLTKIDSPLTDLLGIDEVTEMDDIISLPESDDTFDFNDLPGTSELSMQLRRISVVARMSRVSNVNDFLPPIELIEEYSIGKFKGSPLLKYFLSGNKYYMLLINFLIFFFAQVTASAADYWASLWTTHDERMMNMYETMKYNEYNLSIVDIDVDVHDPHHTTEYYMYMLIGVTSMTIILCTLKTFTLYNLCMNSSEKLHNRMLSTIVHSRLNFFDENPSGRILNRISKDVGSMDEALSKVLLDTAQIFLSITGSYITVIIVNYKLLVPLAVTYVLFYYVRKIYIKSSTCLRRLEGICKSPVLSHLNATVQGLSTIRSSGAEKVLTEEFDKHQDLHTSTYYIFQASSIAFGMFIDALSFMFTAIAILSLLLLHDSTPSEVGLSVTLLLITIGITQWAVRQSAEVANNLTSVERILEYVDLEQEPTVNVTTADTYKNWPTHGQIEFQKVYMKYVESKPFVLKNLTITIHSKEKIGVVGRTGAGKSSVIAALFRLGIIDGTIKIDGTNTKDIPLEILRSNISIIPQDPALFSGTLRHNLDPFEMYSDSVIWSAVENVELKDMFKDTGGLNTIITESGSNLSVGQKQLLCLARAIIRDNKILVLDEATANVDSRTDSLIQDTIRQKFSNCTVLTVAHRLHTIIDSDRILVIDAGRLEEFDQPHILLQNRHSQFYKMVEQTGKQMSEKLRQTAEQNFKAKSKE